MKTLSKSVFSDVSSFFFNLVLNFECSLIWIRLSIKGVFLVITFNWCISSVCYLLFTYVS